MGQQADNPATLINSHLNSNSMNPQAERVQKGKESIAHTLISNDFRCKDNNGHFLPPNVTFDILVRMPIERLKNLNDKYMSRKKEAMVYNDQADCVFNAVWHRTGLSHFKPAKECLKGYRDWKATQAA